MAFESAIKKQEATANYILRFLINLKKLGEEKLTLSLYETRLELLESYWVKFETRHEELLDQKEFSSSDYAQNDLFSKVEDAYVTTKAYLRQQAKDLEPKYKADHKDMGKVHTTTGRLPKVSLPTFSGDYLKWENFRDLFTSVVHQAPDLSDGARLQYLKSLLIGEAAQLIANIPITDATYVGAWNALVDRYDDKRILMAHHFNHLLSLKAVPAESSQNLKVLLDTTMESRRALQNLGRPVEHWDDWFVHLTVQKLDHTSRKDWETRIGAGRQIPSLDELTTFLTGRIRALDAVGAPSTPLTMVRNRGSTSSNFRAHSTKVQVSTSSNNCILCNGRHYIGYCSEFQQKTPQQRIDIVKRLNLCFNCLRCHSISSCSSAKRCSTCNNNHHSLLHLKDDSVNPGASRTISSAHASTNSTVISHSALLATALVKVTASNGNAAVVRALLDQGSEATFISEDLTQRLHLSRTKVHIPVTGMGATPCGTVKSLVHVQLSSDVKEHTPTVVNVSAFVLPNLMKTFRPQKISPNSWPHLKTLQLSDSGSSAYNIDLVLGADLYGYILKDGLVKGPPGTPVAQNTIFGWVISGRTENQQTPFVKHSSLTTFHCSVDVTLAEEMQKFWEIEDVIKTRPLTPEEQQCQDHFQATHTRASDGRYVVRLPRRLNILLGNSHPSALRVFHRTEVQRQKDEFLNQSYKTFMKEYNDLGHMSLAPTMTDKQPNCYYLPHHAVWKSEGTSSKIRVVFNASARTSNGYSLNDSLLPGPKLQEDLSHILLRWRRHAFVFSTDIVKMFRQIWVHPDDQHLQQILWRDSPEKELQTFQLKTVTYGTACAPYLAIRCLQQLAKDEALRFPETANIIQTQTYVDDILSGADTLERVLELKVQLEEFLMAGGFKLAKWAFNFSDPAGSVKATHFLSDGSVKTLGVLWSPETDCFGFQVNLEPLGKITKRTILSQIARLFDPLGWLAPVLIIAKLFIQDLWTVKSDWDADLPPALEDMWTKYYRSLTQLQEVRIRRWIYLNSNSFIQIHGFCDASQRAYAAAVYLRVTNSDGTVRTSLLAAKTKVAPLKIITLPRLELCGAVLLARLLHSTVKALQCPVDISIHAWTDSQVVLAWINAVPARWKTFVANRVSEIHNLLPHAHWHHIPSADNPADLPSRGIQPSEIIDNTLWWSGPVWLNKSGSCWPQSPLKGLIEESLTEQNSKVHSYQISLNEPWELLDKYSSLTKLLRITSWLMRSCQNFRNTKECRKYGPITPQEILTSRNFWIKSVQQHLFNLEITALRTEKPISSSSSLRNLQPFLDSEGLLRVGGRLQNTTMSFDEKHPIILSAQSNFSRLLILDAHHRTLHGGPQLTLSHLSRHFWILRGRNLVKKLLRSCVTCFRFAARVENPLMGQLPAARVTPSRPFLHTGLDYAGPISLRTAKGRGHKAYKGYIALFVCMVTKAIHLEAVSDYTTTSFIAAFKRFCSRRGIPVMLYSDQATNFRGADIQLQALFNSSSKESQEIAELIANDGTHWNFIPPHSPHFGGLWEAGVKSVKHHLRRTIGDIPLTFEEFTTVLAEIEACLNSRPLTPLSSSPQDFTALTPGHFLIGSSLKTIPQPSHLDTSVNRLDRWQLLRRLSAQFWRRWSAEYVRQLQQRTKWRTKTANLCIDDLVLVREDNLPPSKWSLGRVTQVHPGADGIVRVATIRTSTSEFRRPVAKLCKLPDSA